MENRIEGIGSIRGLAAFTVLLHHCFLVMPALPFILRISPLGVLINGQAAVILFFVLSGFVLSLSYFRGANVSYKTFIKKRFLRIYIPYLVAIIMAMLLSSIFSKGGIQELSSWFNDSWSTKLSISLILEHLILIGDVHTNAFDNVIWSLVHEMRISLIFPLIVLSVNRFSWKINVVLCIILSSCAGLNTLFNFQTSSGYFITYFDTMHYTSMFIIGALLAKNKETLVDAYKKLSVNYKWVILILAFICYNYSEVIEKTTKFFGIPFGMIFSEYFVTIGVSVFLIFSLGSLRITKIITKKPILFLGKISYSLYLYHLIVLFSLINLLYGLLPLQMIILLSILITILVSALAWYLIENPAMKLSHNISKQRVNLKETYIISQENKTI